MRNVNYNVIVGVHSVNLELVYIAEKEVCFFVKSKNMQSFYSIVETDLYKQAVIYRNSENEEIRNPFLKITKEFGKLSSFCLIIGIGCKSRYRGEFLWYTIILQILI